MNGLLDANEQWDDAPWDDDSSSSADLTPVFDVSAYPRNIDIVLCNGIDIRCSRFSARTLAAVAALRGKPVDADDAQIVDHRADADFVKAVCDAPDRDTTVDDDDAEVSVERVPLYHPNLVISVGDKIVNEEYDHAAAHAVVAIEDALAHVSDPLARERLRAAQRGLLRRPREYQP